MAAKEKKPRKTFETEQINVRLSSALLNQLDRIGEPLGIRRSLLIQQSIVEYIERHGLNAQKPDQDKPRRP